MLTLPDLQVGYRQATVDDFQALANATDRQRYIQIRTLHRYRPFTTKRNNAADARSQGIGLQTDFIRSTQQVAIQEQLNGIQAIREHHRREYKRCFSLSIEGSTRNRPK